MPQNTESAHVLSPDHTFVVQLYADTQVEAGCVAGRVEHLVSRYATSFQSLEALLAFMAQMLRNVEGGEEHRHDIR